MCCRFIPSHLPLSIQELDENHMGRFSFSSEETVIQVCVNHTQGVFISNLVFINKCVLFFLASQLMNQQSIKSLQVALACQVAQKNALMSAVKMACVCRWAQSETSAAEVGLTDPTATFHMYWANP